ncbi:MULTISPECIES: 2OG-Fe(II) oxygenase [unclassified Sphingomonas]|uniref:2OG-Fe(II) oxygenase n=1 Tax=unclassified Sphingomonas TaxID=196159 RepID=UPI000BC83BD5|nr:MAG: proline hydroxylase [Sphingomonas sp. 32-62-10]
MIPTSIADPARLVASLDAQGWALIPGLLSATECTVLAESYGDDRQFRSRIVMARHGFGQGHYAYFAYPLPSIVQRLRETLYPLLVPTARAWAARLGLPDELPAEHAAYRAMCHAAGQTRPTPLMLRYGEGDYNCLHQDLYGAIAFPLQVAVLLSRPGDDFDGGEFVLTEQRPRMQSRVTVVPLGLGDAVVFAVNHRPVRGGKGDYRVTMRHGVSPIRQGNRHTLGIIFHDAG